ncbi:MAG: hypothetical protein NVS4B3_18060 [Gemmatimonadaceae bacterium]
MCERGLLVVFEGIEGSGKTTQIQRLLAHLVTTGERPVTMREPGGTALGDTIRGLVLDPSQEIIPRAEALLFMASRAQLVVREIGPALAAGRIILMDRFFLSTYAYQIAGRGLGEEGVRAANALAIEGVRPDVTIVLTVPPAVGLARAQNRGTPDRMERADAAFHGRVAQAFALYATEAWQRAHPECGRIVAVDASRDGDAVAADVAAILADLIRNRRLGRFLGDGLGGGAMVRTVGDEEH